MEQKILNTRLYPGQIALFYLGQMGFLLKYSDRYILIDGYLSDYVDRNCCTNTLRWKRNYPAPIKPEALSFVDYVFCTHAHPDHADPDTLSVLAQINSKAIFLVPKPIRERIAAFGLPGERLLGVSADQRIPLCPGVAVTPVPAAHEELHRGEDGAFCELGYLMHLGETTVYHAGDCCPYDGLGERVQGSHIMILPVNGRDYYRRYRDEIIGCFTPEEAVTLAKDACTRLLIPAHLGLYDVNTLNPAQFVDCLQRAAPYQAFHLFVPGEGYVYDPTL